MYKSLIVLCCALLCITCSEKKSENEKWLPKKEDIERVKAKCKGCYSCHIVRKSLLLEDQIMCSLKRAVVIDGFLFTQRGVAFHPNGKVFSGSLKKVTTINGIKFVLDISFYPNGKVSSGQLAEDTTINGVFYQQYDIVNFLSNGKVRGD